MTDTHLKMQLEKATLDLDKTTDVEGILIVASDGRILHHNLRVDVDMNLFGPMSQVISNSSHRLLNSSGQGEMERVLVESSGGKALFLGLENTHLIILMQDTANVGLILVNAKRASKKIDEATKDIVLEVPEEVPEKVTEIIEEIPELPVEEVPAEEMAKEEEYPSEIHVTEEIVSEEVKKISSEASEGLKAYEVALDIQEEHTEEPVEELPEKPVAEPTEKLIEGLAEEPVEISEDTVKLVEDPAVTEQLEAEEEFETAKIGELKEVEVEKVPETVETAVEEEKVEEAKPSIPTVKPPISFPPLPEHVEVPDDPENRSELILDIYEKIFLAMSMGAAKIMGVAPARGLTKQFLPFEKCQRLLQNVDLKSNATIDFAQIKKNAAEIPVEEREEIFIKDFSRMIEIITENYGRVMGYEAFRGMVRAEFLAINKSYGEAMDKLSIKQNMHPEIAILFS